MKNKKKTSLILIAVVILAVLVIAYFLYETNVNKKNSNPIYANQNINPNTNSVLIPGVNSNQNRTQKVINYKKIWYNSILCIYNCPLKLQNISNKTEMIPDLICVDGCSKLFKDINQNNSFTKQELALDNLVNDVQNTIKDCRNKTYSSKLNAFNSTALFPCISDELKLLKNKYSYLD